MKYIITETQKDRLEKIIIDYFEKNIIPSNGWKSKKEYEKEIGYNDGELFINLSEIDDTEDFYDDEHIWYSECNNDNLSEPLPEGHCPLLELTSSLYHRLDGYFGDIWRPLFKEWFTNKTGLPIIQISKSI
jgi:hypothetical protein